MNAKRVALLGILTSLSVIMFLVESLFPPLLVPGAKLGLGNIFVMLALIYLNLPSALVMVVVKCLISAIFGGVSAILYSLPSGIVSVVVSYLMLKFTKRISIVAVSCLSAVIHNLVQNLVFVLVVNTVSVFVYAPYLALIGSICGVMTGLAVYFILKYLTPFVIKTFNIKIQGEV